MTYIAAIDHLLTTYERVELGGRVWHWVLYYAVMTDLREVWG